jgi:solute carrier family 32 (vesicular inhibitory amino acid transporter)
MKLFRDGISAREKLFMWAIMVVSTTMSVVGTVWAFLPKAMLGVE